MAGVKKNFAYNFLLSISGYFFALITYPYVSRVLGVQNIGVCNYVDSIINYFILFSTLGIGSLGIREVARVKDDRNKLDSVFSSLLTINLVLTVVGAVLLVFLTLFVPFFSPYRQFLLVGLVKLMFNPLLVEWFYQGISNFKYVTIRTLFIRIIYVAAVFYFVRSQNDTLMFYLLTTLTVVANSLVNIACLKNFTRFDFKSINISAFVVPVLSFGVYRILTSMYTNFNVTYLGSVSTVEEVGFFSTATKLYTILMCVFSAFSGVMVPKVSELLAKGDRTKLMETANKTFNLIFDLSVPIIFVSLMYAPFIVNLIAGAGYEGAVIPFRIVMALLLVVALEQIVIAQFLMAQKDNKCIIVLSLVGAFAGVMANIMLVPSLNSIGSACSWVLSESVVLIVGVYYFKTKMLLAIPFARMFKSVLCSIPILIIAYFFADTWFSVKLFVGLFMILIVFIVNLLFVLRNDEFRAMLKLKKND